MTAFGKLKSWLVPYLEEPRVEVTTCSDQHRRFCTRCCAGTPHAAELCMAEDRNRLLRPRPRHYVIGIALLALIVAAVVLGWPSTAAPQDTPRCIQFWPESRYRDYRYDHIVHVINNCQSRASCAVSSDVTPTPVRAEVSPGESIEVLTARDSQLTEFTPRVECGLML